MEGSASGTSTNNNNGQQQSSNQSGTPGNIVSAGRPERADMNLANFMNTTSEEEGGGEGAGGAGGNEGQNSQQNTNSGGNGSNNGTGADDREVDIDAVKKFLQKQGITFDGSVDDLKSKFAAATQKAEPSAEEKEAAAKALDKRMLDLHINSGGTAEDYVRLKTIASSDLREISVATIKSEMKDEGFTDEQIEAIIQERYYQLNPDEVVQGDDETDEDYNARKELIKKKVALGSKKLDNRGSSIKQKAESFLSTLKSAIEAEDLLAAKEVEFASKVDDAISKLPQTFSVELGEINGQKVDPISVPVSEEVRTQIASVLKDPAKRTQYFFNSDNSLNLENVLQLMMRNGTLEAALGKAYADASSRQVEEFRKVFPGIDPHEIGVGGKTPKQGRKGVLTSAGKPEPMPVKR